MIVDGPRDVELAELGGEFLETHQAQTGQGATAWQFIAQEPARQHERRGAGNFGTVICVAL